MGVATEQHSSQSEQALELEMKLQQAQEELRLAHEQATSHAKKDGRSNGWGSTAAVAGVTAAVVLLAVWVGNTLRRRMRI